LRAFSKLDQLLPSRLRRRVKALQSHVEPLRWRDPDAMVDPEVALWDVAPMPVIISEAGGTFTDFAGVTDATSPSAVATGGVDHAELLALLTSQA